MPWGTYQVFCTRQRYLELRPDPAFWRMVTFSHVLNSLRTCVLATVLNDEPKAKALGELSINRFFTTAATLHEALAFANRLGEHFRGLSTYGPFASFVNSADVSDLDRKVLLPVRKKVTFHFDDHVADIARERFHWPNLVFEEGFETSEGVGLLSKFPFGDVAVVYSVIGGDCEFAEFSKAMGRAIDGTYKATMQYLERGDALARDIFQFFGFERRPVPEGPAKW